MKYIQIMFILYRTSFFNGHEVSSKSNVVPTQYVISEAASVFTLTATATQSPPVCVLIETHGQRGERRAQ